MRGWLGPPASSTPKLSGALEDVEFFVDGPTPSLGVSTGLRGCPLGVIVFPSYLARTKPAMQGTVEATVEGHQSIAEWYSFFGLCGV